LCCQSRFIPQFPDKLNGAKVLLKLLLRTARAQVVVIGDAIAVKVFGGIFLLISVG
jgi:hypothetical protein